MDIQATKLELMRLLLNTQKEHVLSRLKEVFDQEGETDFWDNLSKEDQKAIDEGISQLDKGQHLSHEAVQKEIEKRLPIK